MSLVDARLEFKWFSGFEMHQVIALACASVFTPAEFWNVL